MGNVIKQIENFLRGEPWLHITTMFLLITILGKVFQILWSEPLIIIQAIIILLVAYLWEYGGKKLKNKEINWGDITYSIIGGVLGILVQIIT